MVENCGKSIRTGFAGTPNPTGVLEEEITVVGDVEGMTANWATRAVVSAPKSIAAMSIHVLFILRQ